MGVFYAIFNMFITNNEHMKKLSILSLSTLSLSILPSIAFAQGPNLNYIQNAVDQIGFLVEQLIPLVIGIGLLFFIWGLVQFILASGSEEAKEVGKRRMIWGILALFVIVSVWGLVQLLAEISGVQLGAAVALPSVDFLN